MANTLLTPSVIARAALANLYENCVMAQLVHRDYEPEFANKVGDTITVRKPAKFEAKEFNRANGIEIQNATETGVAVTLNHFADVSFAVTSEDLTLKIEDFSEQFLDPAMEAMAQKIDRDILALRADITQETGVAPSSLWSTPEALVDAGAILDGKNVALNDRRAVVGPLTKAAWLKTDTLKPADRSGSTEALRDAGLGNRLFGFDPYMTQNIKVPSPQGAGISTTEESLAFHKTAFALVTRPLALPQGTPSTQASIVNYKGFGLRLVYGYDITKKQDVVSLDCLYGTKTLDANRAVLIKGADGA